MATTAPGHARAHGVDDRCGLAVQERGAGRAARRPGCRGRRPCRSRCRACAPSPPPGRSGATTTWSRSAPRYHPSPINPRSVGSVATSPTIARSPNEWSRSSGSEVMTDSGAPGDHARATPPRVGAQVGARDPVLGRQPARADRGEDRGGVQRERADGRVERARRRRPRALRVRRRPASVERVRAHALPDDLDAERIGRSAARSRRRRSRVPPRTSGCGGRVAEQRGEGGRDVVEAGPGRQGASR